MRKNNKNTIAEIEDKDFKIIEKIAKIYPKTSDNYKVLEKATYALHFISNEQKKITNYLKTSNKPLGAIELIHMKLCGIKIPKRFNNMTINEIEKDMDKIVKKLKRLITKQST